MPTTTPLAPSTKGIRLAHPATAASLIGRRIDDPAFAWPLLTLDDEALTHNIKTAAQVCASRGVHHAPHVKTHMSKPIWQRQADAGAWAATVASPNQLRTVLGWGVKRAFLANELVDSRDADWLQLALESDPELEVWLQIDSEAGLSVLTRAFGDSPARHRLGILIEYGVAGGRTGLRTSAEVVALARATVAAGLRLRGVTGYEGPIAGHADPASLAAVAAWCADLRAVAEQVRPLVAQALGDGVPLTISAGGSAYLDIILDELPADATTQVIVRSGAYVTHDHGHYAEVDPWARIPGAPELIPAIRVWGQVLSAPEPGLALVGLGRRDVSFDLDLPFPLRARRPDASGSGRLGGRLGEPWDLRPADARVVELNDQHAFVRFNPQTPAPNLQPGDVIEFGISHPCTTLDKWRIAAITNSDVVTDIYPLDF